MMKWGISVLLLVGFGIGSISCSLSTVTNHYPIDEALGRQILNQWIEKATEMDNLEDQSNYLIRKELEKYHLTLDQWEAYIYEHPELIQDVQKMLPHKPLDDGTKRIK